MDEKRLNELRKYSTIIRRHIIEAVYNAKSGHPGGSLSSADIITVLYFNEMRVDPKNPAWEDRTGLFCRKATVLRHFMEPLPREAFSLWKSF